MTQPWPDLGSPTSGDGIVLSAILGRLDDILKVLQSIAPKEAQVTFDGAELRKVQEPAPAAEPTAAEHVSEPAPVDDPAPPRVGRGGSTEAWAEWAGRRGVLVEPGTSRAQIIAACQRAGVLADG